MLAFSDLAEASNGVFEFYVLAGAARKLLRDVERLREESLNLSRARHNQLIVIRQLVDTENRDDVLKVLVALENSLYFLSSAVVIFADDARIENARRRLQWVHC